MAQPIGRPLSYACCIACLQCVFATCDDEDYFRSHIKPLVGKTVKLSVSADSVTLTEAPQGSASYAGSNGAAANGNGAAASNGSGAKRSAAAGATSEWLRAWPAVAMQHMGCHVRRPESAWSLFC
jgi:hypothetical protein